MARADFQQLWASFCQAHHRDPDVLTHYGPDTALGPLVAPLLQTLREQGDLPNSSPSTALWAEIFRHAIARIAARYMQPEMPLPRAPRMLS